MQTTKKRESSTTTGPVAGSASRRRQAKKVAALLAALAAAVTAAVGVLNDDAGTSTDRPVTTQTEEPLIPFQVENPDARVSGEGSVDG